MTKFRLFFNIITFMSLSTFFISMKNPSNYPMKCYSRLKKLTTRIFKKSVALIVIFGWLKQNSFCSGRRQQNQFRRIPSHCGGKLSKFYLKKSQLCTISLHMYNIRRKYTLYLYSNKFLVSIGGPEWMGKC